jgi:transcriptional regulator GlxA family with amidase domain
MLGTMQRNRPRQNERSSFSEQREPDYNAVNQVDAKFLRRLIEVVEENLSDFGFSMDALAGKMAVSRRSLFRKLKSMTGRSPNSFLRSMRLQRAARLLQTSDMTVTEITFAVGFSDLKHFRVVFRDHFGTLPSGYAKVACAAGEPGFSALNFGTLAPQQ